MKSIRFRFASSLAATTAFSLCLPLLSMAQLSGLSGSESSGETQDTAAAIASTSSMEKLDDERELEIGDVLAFRIVEDRSAPFSLVVTDSGQVEVPFIGRVMAKGKTARALAYEIKEELEKDHYQQATVIVGLDWSGTRKAGFNIEAAGYDGRVNVWGAVGREGPIAIPSTDGLTLAEAILAAGGFTPFAKTKKVRVHRIVTPGAGENSPEKLAASRKKLTQIIIVNVKDIMEKGDLSKNIALKPNDVIIVEEKFFNF